MDSELKSLLEKNLAASEESLKILKKMRRAALFGRFFQAAKWILILALLAFGFVQLQPYFPQIVEVYSGFTDIIRQFNALLPTP